MELEDSDGARTTSPSPEIIIIDDSDSMKPACPKVQGVYFSKRKNEWVAQLSLNGHRIRRYFSGDIEGYKKAVSTRKEMEKERDKIIFRKQIRRLKGLV